MIEEIVIDWMRPSFIEWLDMSFDWEEYSNELDLMLITVFHKWSYEKFIADLNFSMTHGSNTSKYTAACDVASTLESLAPEKYAKQFIY